MNETFLEQVHGYRSGHQMLESSASLDRPDQDTVDRLSDIAGPLGPGERFAPYFTGYPLPSGKYYVLARTEQDTEAARAGCVLTHSLIMSQRSWCSGETGHFFAHLASIPVMQRGLSTVAATTVIDPAPNIEGSVLYELTEALFLEKRSPTVVFEIANAAFIVTRLTTALWPSLRQSFAFCTFTLSPRSIGNRPFDLLFAPKTARSRFAEWPGRKLESSASSEAPRHRWTPILEAKIFRSPSPSLMLESDSPVRPGKNNEESGLRLTLLWEELKQKVPNSPTAALGLIDIAKSQSSLETSWRSLLPFVQSALRSILARSPTGDVWAFFTALATKVGTSLSDEAVRGLIAETAESMVDRDASSAIGFLATERLEEGSVRRVLYDELAHAIGARGIVSVIGDLLMLEPAKLLRIVLASEQLADQIFDTLPAAADAHLLDRLADALDSAPAVDKLTSMTLLTHIRKREHQPVLESLVAGSDGAIVTAATKTIWSNGVRDIELLKTLNRAAISSSMQPEVRRIYNSGNDDGMTFEAIFGLLEPIPEDFRWLLDARGFVRAHRASFINRLVGNARRAQLEAALQEDHLFQDCLSVLLRQPDEHLDGILALLDLGRCDSTWTTSTLLNLRKRLRGPERRQVDDRIHEIITTDPPLEIEMYLAAMAATITGRSIPKMIRAARDPQQLDAVLISAGALKGEERTAALRDIFDIVDAALRKPKGYLKREGADALASMLANASKHRAPYLRACSAALDFALKSPSQPYSSLVVASFPSVYEELRKDTDNFGIFRMFSFIDWDKCKTARTELIRTFMRSDWRSIDLAVAALRSGDIDLFFEKIAREYKGAQYVGSMLEGLDSLNAKESKAIKKAIYAVLD